MMRLQKLVVAMAMTGALGSGLANALGLGEVTLHSSLNQPLDAEIELLQLRDLTRNEILPNLASRSDFQRAAIDRPFTLSGLNFRTKIREDGTGYIHVTSADAVQEPFLNFLMEVHWPSGRLLREYTLLLDPPAFSEQPVAPVRPATTQPYSARPPIQEPNPFVEPEAMSGQDYFAVPDDALQAETRAIPQRPVNTVQTTEDDVASGSMVRNYEVQPRDNLWSIARAVRPSGEMSVQQTMVAIQRLNPKAFMRENINELKKGQVLRIPDQDEIRSVSYQDSVADVARQNREWQARLEQLDASRRSQADVTGSGASGDGRLSIVGSDNASGNGQDLGGGTGNAESEALQNELSMTREKMDELSRENEELRSRMKDLDEQIETLKRLITLKDDQMTALQSSSAEPAAEPEQKPAPKPDMKPMTPPQDPGFIGFLMSNPLFMILAALVPIGLIGAFLVYRRRKQAMDEEMIDVEDDSVGSMPLMGDDLVAEDDELQLDESLEIDEEALSDVGADEEPEETVQQTQDVLSEADIYIAYGRFPQAAELLGKSIAAEPDRTDLRLKLLEVHAEANDLDSFRAALADLEALGNDDANRQADVFKARFPADAFMQQGGGSVESDLSDVDLSEGVDDELDFDLDDLEDDEPAIAESEPGDDLDFDLDDDDEPAGELPELDLDDLDLDDDEEDEGDDQLSEEFGDLDLDFDDEKSEETAITESMSDLEAALDDDDDLDFLSDEDEVSTKLDLARAYMDMGDQEGAREILQEVLDSGSDEQKEEAQALVQALDG